MAGYFLFLLRIYRRQQLQCAHVTFDICINDVLSFNCRNKEYVNFVPIVTRGLYDLDAFCIIQLKRSSAATSYDLTDLYIIWFDVYSILSLSISLSLLIFCYFCT